MRRFVAAMVLTVVVLVPALGMRQTGHEARDIPPTAGPPASVQVLAAQQ